MVLYGYSIGGGKIDNCINKATVIGNPPKSSGSLGTGGIVGMADNTNILNSCNLGEIKLGTTDSYTSIGGLIGFVRMSVTIGNSFNIGNVGEKCNAIGGIIGAESPSSTVTLKNIYNFGKIKFIPNSTGQIIGGIHASSSGEGNNIYYPSGDIGMIGYNENQFTGAGKALEESYMKSQAFVELLNSYEEDGKYPSNWKYWKLGEEGYPIHER